MSSWEEDNSWMIDAYESEIDAFYSGEPVWETNSGQRIPVSQMETSHIKNCIKMIYKSNGTWRNEFLRIFEEELRNRRWDQRLSNEQSIILFRL